MQICEVILEITSDGWTNTYYRLYEEGVRSVDVL